MGDFATAGSATFHLADYLSESVGRVEIGADGHKRAVAAMSPDLGEDWRAVAAAELFNEDGPFIHPEGYNRFNGYAKVTRLLDPEERAVAHADGVQRDMGLCRGRRISPRAPSAARGMGRRPPGPTQERIA